MNIRIRSHLALTLLFVTAIFCTTKTSTAADAHPPFTGEKTTWHSDFDRYDFSCVQSIFVGGGPSPPEASLNAQRPRGLDTAGT